MRRKLAGTLLLIGTALFPHTAWAQFAGHVIYEVGGAMTDVGPYEGGGTMAYGFGAGVTQSFFSTNRIGLVVGADVLVRAFGVSLPGRVENGVGVFDQSDLVLDEIVAVRLRRVLAGLYLEQRRIDRGTSLGTINFPTSAIGFLVDLPIGDDSRSGVRVSYARYRSGSFRLQGSAVEPEINSGRSIRVSGRYFFSTRWGVQVEYADVEIVLDDLPPTFTFFDHRQKTLGLGVLLSF